MACKKEQPVKRGKVMTRPQRKRKILLDKAKRKTRKARATTRRERGWWGWRSLLFVAGVGLGLCLGACAPPQLVVETPLFVVETFPANGASVEATMVQQVILLFSEKVDPASLKGHLHLQEIDTILQAKASSKAIAIEGCQREEESLAVRCPLGASIQAQLTTGKSFRLDLSSGVQSVAPEGSSPKTLLTSQSFYFRLR